MFMAVVGTLLATLLTPGTASAAPFKCGSRCNFKDPATYVVSGTTRCGDDAVTVDTAWHGSEYIELRYSPYCQTIWIRGNAYVSTDGVIGAAMDTHPYGDLGTEINGVYLPVGNGVRYSQMLDDAGVCGMGQIYAGGSAYDFTICY
jgi:hypothetical protein